MVTIGKVKDSGRSARYFQRQVQQQPGVAGYLEEQTQGASSNPRAGGIVAYVEASGEPPGHWFGTAPLGVEPGSIVSSEEALERILNGRHPTTNEPLTKTVDADHVPGWEVVIAAPKTVSSAWAVASPGLRVQIEQAHEAAVQTALSYLDAHAGWTRRGEGGQEREQVHLLGAIYQHSTSRAVDPHLHDHILVANAAQRADGSWGTIVSHDLYEHRAAMDAIYMSALAQDLQALGFDLERTNTNALAIEISGVPDLVRDGWSTRHNQMAAHGQSAEADAAWDQDRPEKDLVNRVANFERWSHEAGKLHWGARALDELQARGHGQAPTADVEWDRAMSDLTSRDSTFSEADMVRALASHSYGHWGPQQVLAQVEDLIGHAGELNSRILRLDANIYTTRGYLSREQAMVLDIRELAAPFQGAPADPEAVQAAIRAAVERGRPLSLEQRTAVEVAAGDSRLATIQGHAGVGKTTALAAVREAYEASGYTVIGATASRQAAKELEQGAGIASTSLAGLRVANEASKETQWTLGPSTVLVVDEASMASVRDLSEVLRLANDAGSKVVLVGDERQLPAIGPGGGFHAAREIAKAVGVDASIETIIRQQEAWQREATTHLARGNAMEALRAYDEAGRVHVANTTQTMAREIVQQWAQDHAEHPEQTQLIVTSTHGAAATINHLAQQARLQAGKLGAQVAVGLPTAKEGPVDLHRGDHVTFRRNDRDAGLRNGQVGEVVGATSDGRITVSTEGGLVQFDPTRYREWHLGYATTIHSAQGMTVDRSYYAVSSRDGASAVYVAASRQRVDLHIYIPKDVYQGLRTQQEREEHVRLAAKEAHDRILARAGHQLERREEKHLARDRDHGPGRGEDAWFRDQSRDQSRGADRASHGDTRDVSRSLADQK